MEVGGETRLWQEGQVSMFDDNQTHHAWNRTQENRFVLIVDVDNRRLT
jgi:beta-hydroxylase